MNKHLRAFAILSVLIASVSLVGCSAPIEESKPVQAGDGTSKPSIAGASASGGGGAPAPSTDAKGKAPGK